MASEKSSDPLLHRMLRTFRHFFHYNTNTLIDVCVFILLSILSFILIVSPILICIILYVDRYFFEECVYLYFKTSGFFFLGLYLRKRRESG
jgi:hypothetical protein